MKIETAGYFIVGLTKDGKKFRPSDWVERIAGGFARFGADRRLSYNPLILPVRKDGLSGLFIADSLASVDPVGYQFVMEFADSYQLQVKRIGQSGQQQADITLPNVA